MADATSIGREMRFLRDKLMEGESGPKIRPRSVVDGQQVIGAFSNLN